MIGVPPFRAELGIIIRYHVPAVHALPRPAMVCHERGLEALYPDCERVYVPRREDGGRYYPEDKFTDLWAGRLRNMGATEVVRYERGVGEEKRFLPEPYSWQLWRKWRGRGFHIVICPRLRRWGANKNWSGWRTVALDLRAARRTVFAAGARQTSDVNVVADDAAWRYPRELDACIEAMRQTRLVVATDAGLAHLALLVGVPLLLVGSSGGLVAPGPATDDKGKVVAPQFWPVRLGEYYHAANHREVPIVFMPDGWEHPHKVAQRALEMTA